MSWILTIIGISILVLLHEAGHFTAAKAVGMRVERFSLFFGKPVVSVRRGETEYGIGWAPLGGYVKISGMNPREELPPEVQARAYFRQPVWKRLVVIGAGPFVNIVLAFVILAGLYLANGKFVSDGTVGSVERGSPAAAVLRPGDRVLSVDGKHGDPAAFAAQIGTHKCAGAPRAGCTASTPATLAVRRDGRVVTVRVTPRYDDKLQRMRVGFAYGGQVVGRGVGQASGDAVSTMWDVTSQTVGVIGRLFYSSKARHEVSGIVGTADVTRQSFETDYAQAVLILGLVSLSLAVVNLLPFLPLDGGHIFWALAEKVRGRAIPFSVMERASVVGFVLILMLFFIGLQNDISRISDGTLNVR